MLARTHNPEAEKYLRAALRLSQPLMWKKARRAHGFPWDTRSKARSREGATGLCQGAELTPADPSRTYPPRCSTSAKNILRTPRANTKSPCARPAFDRSRHWPDQHLYEVEPTDRRRAAAAAAGCGSPYDEGCIFNSAAFLPLKKRKTMRSLSYRALSRFRPMIQRRNAIWRTFIWRGKKRFGGSRLSNTGCGPAE